MNIDPTVPATADAPLAPPEWSMEVEETGHCAATLKRGNRVMCRLSLNSERRKCRTALARSARVWIKDYLARSSPASSSA